MEIVTQDEPVALEETESGGTVIEYDGEFYIHAWGYAGDRSTLDELDTCSPGNCLVLLHLKTQGLMRAPFDLKVRERSASVVLR